MNAAHIRPTKSSLVLVGFVVVALFASAGCRQTARNSDEIARIVSRTNTSHSTVASLLDDLARNSSRNADDLARQLASIEAPTRESGFLRATDSMAEGNVERDLAKGILCDILTEAAKEVNGIDHDSLEKIVASNVVGSLGGTTAQWRQTLEGITDDLASGAASNDLWTQITLLNLIACS